MSKKFKLHSFSLSLAYKYRSKYKVNFLKWFIVFNTFVLFIQCSVDNPDKLKVFKYNEATSIGTLDPAFVKSQSENWVVAQINAGLVQLDTQLSIKPMVADSWSISDNGLSYTFYLKHNVYFHPWEENGERKVTAYDVKYSFERLMNPKTASPGTWVFSDKVDLTKAFEVQDSHTFILHLTQPFPPLLGLLSMPYCYILPEEAILHFGKDFRNSPIGCGPFVFKRWEEHVGIVLTKFNNYFEYLEEDRLPYLDAINISLNPNKPSAFMDFASGKYDFFNEIEAGVKDEILDPYGNLTAQYKGKFVLKKAPFLNTEFLMFNMESDNALVKSKEIRKAMNLAINRAAIVNNVRNGLGIPATAGFTPPSLLNSKSNGFKYDVIEAKKLIQSSGIDISQELKLGITAQYMDMALYIKNDLEKLGFNIKIDVYPSSHLRQLRNEKQLDFYRGSWIADYPDAENYLACFYSKNHYPKGPNYSRFNSAIFDNLYKSSMNEYEPQARQKLLSEMDEELLSNPPFIVLYYDKSLRITKPNIKNLWSYPNNMLQLKFVDKQL